MSWLRRIFGEGGEDGDAPRRAHGRDEGPRTDTAKSRSPAKAALLAALRERGARSAVIAYEGGNDEGWITEFSYSSARLGADPAAWTGEALPDATVVDIDTAIEAKGGPDDELFEAGEAVMADKWGGFAGEFEVEGRLVVDVDAGRIVRRDAVSVEGDPAVTEVEAI